LRSEICDQVILSITLFLIVFAPLAFGAVEAWALGVIEFSVLLMFCAWAVKIVTLGKLSFTRPPFFTAFSLFLILVLFQFTPLPRSWRDFLSPSVNKRSQLPRTYPNLGHSQVGAPWTRLTVNPEATKGGFVNLVSYLGLCLVLLNNLRPREKEMTVLTTLIAVGSFEALYGLVEYWTGHQYIFWYKKAFYLGEVTGTYINHNHFAGLMELVVPLAIGMFSVEYSRYQKNWGSGLKKDLKAKVRPPRLKLTCLLVSIALMLVGLILSKSRAGLISSILSLAFLAFLLPKKRTSPGLTIALVVGFLIGVITLSLNRDVIQRFSWSPYEARIRFGLWKDSAAIVRDFPLWGSGLGTFQYVIPYYRSRIDFLKVSGVPQPAAWYHAHNDYLQLLVECGVIGFLVVMWACGITLWQLFATFRTNHDRESTILGQSLSAGIIALLLHSFIDFNLHIPANALLFCVFLSLSLNIAQSQKVFHSV
jgi:O-antigen ligase